MNSRLHVQKASAAADLETIESLARQIWEQNYTSVVGKTQADYMLGKFQSRSAVENDIRLGFVYYIAFYEGVPCGYSAVKKDERGIFLSKLYVKHGYRGRGIARAMIDEIFEYAKKNKAAKVWLTCSKYNTAYIEMYEKAGFSIASPAGETVSDKASDDYLLEKRLLKN